MNDDTLVLYYYDDGLSNQERRDVEAAIAADESVRARYEELRLQLDQLDTGSDVAAPTHMVQRWHDSIDRAAQRERVPVRSKPGQFNAMSFFWGAAVSAALAVGIGIGVIMSGSPVPVELAPNYALVDPETSSVVPGAFARGMQVHLRDTQRNIVALSGDNREDRTLLVMRIIQQNRLFERAAEQNDSAGLARVLRAFEPILLRLAADDIAPEDADALRRQLAFELNVMLTKLERDTSKETHKT
ncbi:MAG: hypothetical protein OEM64_11950 [Gammaproteobacteria bacterium]|nr:hypothetical protein [Gammaproteobacteria bacterium]MDH3417014.1 hypothetical protein [Gammaproteobacteria bacterium]